MRKKRKSKWVLWVLTLAVLAAGAVYALRYFRPEQSAEDSNLISYAVERGDVSTTVTGSGRLETADDLQIKLPVGVEVETVFVKKGDRVEKGDILAALDVDSLEYRAAQLSSELGVLDMQLASRKTVSAINAPAKGRLKYLPASEGDDVIDTVNTYGCLAILSVDGLMQVSIQTNAAMQLNEEVSVQWYNGSASGIVASRTDGGYLITLDDANAPYRANVSVYKGVQKVGSGIMDIHVPLAVFGNGGTISKIHKQVGDTVSAGTKLFTLENEPAVDSYRQTLYDRRDKAEQMQTVLQLMSNPLVVAQESGTVDEISVVEGQKTASMDGSSETAAFTLGVGGAVFMTVDVDELDISKIRLGQEAQITLDAFSGENFRASVERISYIGEAAGSITTYDVELRLDYDERLLSGMNGSAVVHADTHENVLLVPLTAIHEDANGSYVQLLQETGDWVKTYIQTGLSDGSNAEVTGGLQEGDTVVYRAASNNLFMMPMMGGDFGGMD